MIVDIIWSPSEGFRIMDGNFRNPLYYNVSKWQFNAGVGGKNVFNPTSYGILDSVAATGGGLKDPPSDIMEGVILDSILL